MIIKANVYFEIEGKWNPQEVQFIQSHIEELFTREVIDVNGTKVSWKVNNSFQTNIKQIKGTILTRQQALTGVKNTIMAKSKPTLEDLYPGSK